jgi:UDP:flavonoid glycosyltransferase YjiC (YdhE family)
VLINFQHKKVLVAPLDWGLGHATRCMPIINELLHNDNEVLIAADGAIKNILQNEFPQLQFVNLFNYNIQYSKNGKLLWLSMLKQTKHILNCIQKENNWLNKFIENENIDVIISDNRYGLYNKKVHSVFITHQLKLSIPKPFSIFENYTKLFFEKYIKQFNECWIPDYADEKNNLSGKLSHHQKLLGNTKFIEPLSRFKNYTSTEKPIESDILILISGPEPQRTLFEQKIFNQVLALASTYKHVSKLHFSSLTPSSPIERNGEFENMFDKKIIIVGGNFISTNEKNNLPSFVEYHAAVAPLKLYDYLMGAKKIICRSGYSSVMDLEAINKKAVYVPTPGQTEQEYLARWLQECGAGIFVTQKNFELKNYF